MKLIYDARATAIIYRILCSNPIRGRFIIPANCCHVVPFAFLKAGVEFDLFDISPVTLCLELDPVLEAIKKDAREIGGIIFIRTYGTPNNINDQLQHLRYERTDLLIFDDNCLGIPDFESPVTPAEVVLYSTDYAKFIDLGGGGFAHIKDELKYIRTPLPYDPVALESNTQAIREALELGVESKYIDSDWLATSASESGFDVYRRKLLDAIPAMKEHKRLLNGIYRAAVPQEQQLPDEFQNWRFSILTSDKEVLLKDIFAAKLFASSHYASMGVIFGKGHFPVAEKLHANVVNLFNDYHYTEEMAIRTAEIVHRHYRAGA